jgi:hypothetical protein
MACLIPPLFIGCIFTANSLGRGGAEGAGFLCVSRAFNSFLLFTSCSYSARFFNTASDGLLGLGPPVFGGVLDTGLDTSVGTAIGRFGGALGLAPPVFGGTGVRAPPVFGGVLRVVFLGLLAIYTFPQYDQIAGEGYSSSAISKCMNRPFPFWFTPILFMPYFIATSRTFKALSSLTAISTAQPVVCAPARDLEASIGCSIHLYPELITKGKLHSCLMLFKTFKNSSSNLYAPQC